MTQGNQPRDIIRPLRAIEYRIMETLEHDARPVHTILQAINQGRLIRRTDILTLYRAIHELKRRDLIIIIGDEEVLTLGGQLRRHYRLTTVGQKALKSVLRNTNTD